MVTSGFGQFVRGSGFAVLHARGHTPSETVVVPLQGTSLHPFSIDNPSIV